MQAAGLLHPPGQAPDAPGVPWRSHTREPLPDHIGVRWGSPSHTSGLLQRPKCWPWKCPEAVSPPTALSAGRVGQVHSRRLSRGPCHAPSEHHPRHSGASGCGFSLFCRLWQGSSFFFPLAVRGPRGFRGGGFARISWGRFGEQGLGMPAKQPGPSELRVPFSQWRPPLACTEREQRAGLREGSLTTLQFLNITYWSPRPNSFSAPGTSSAQAPWWGWATAAGGGLHTLLTP